MSDETAKAPRAPWWAWPATLCFVATVGAAAYVATIFAPSPVGPLPAPAPTSLASLVPESEAKAKLGQFYTDFARVVADEKCQLKTTGQFRDAYRFAIPHFQSTARLPSVKAIDEPINQQLQVALGGLEDKPLDATTRTVLSGTLRRIGEEFAR